jgi:6-pyruvoyl-tetrahydropterin synthase
MSKTNVPSKLALTVQTELRASHSLAGFELPHFHLWKIAVQFQADLPLKNDRLIDLVFLQTTLDEILAPISGKYLNEVLAVSPTSENMALWIWQKIADKLPNEPLSSVEITLCNLEGHASGSARIWK